VDDLGLSFESTAYLRPALRKFVDEQMQPHDLVAILRTSAGVGALQEFTTDKRTLHAAVDRVRFSFISRSGIGAFAPVVPPDATGAPGFGGSGTAETTDDETVDGLRTNMLAAGSLGALDYIIRGVEKLAGRKFIVFVSEGFSLIDRTSHAWSAFTRVMDHANRAGVVVYTIDARGLQTGGLTAEDNPQPQQMLPGPPGGSTGPLLQGFEALDAQRLRQAYLRDSQEGLIYMAEQTGGFAVVNNNDLSLGFRRVLDDVGGYYLLGFAASAQTDRPWDGGRVQIRVRRPGLHVRARQGFFGPANPERTAPDPSPDPLVAAALSPFGTGALDVRLTTLFGHDGKRGSYVRSLFFIDPQAVTFEELPGGRQGAQLTFLLLTIDENGKMESQRRRLLDLKLTPDQYRAVRQRGILYNVLVPVKAAGGYQVRAVVRDERSQAIGTGSQFFEVPRVGKGRVALSGVVMQGTTGASSTAAADDGELTLGVSSMDEGVFNEPGVRIFKPGSDAIYICEIYDGVSDASTVLSTYATLLRDGRAVYQSPASPVTPKTRGAVRAVPVAGRLSLGRNMPRGSYTLQITVGEGRDGRARNRASQWVEFEVR